jgi:delta 1-pyrroline-5-carboxylate dehydrogenase
VRLQAKGLPDAIDRRRGKPTASGMLRRFQCVAPAGRISRVRRIVSTISSSPIWRCTRSRLVIQPVEAVRTTGNRATMEIGDPHLAAALFAGEDAELRMLLGRLAERDGPIVPVYCAPYPLDLLFDEISLSINTAAAGGNASLMAIG